MKITEAFLLALKNIRTSKMRTFLTMLGIIIGVMAVIVIVGLGNGLSNYVSDSFASLGTNSMTVMINGRNSSTRNFTVDQMYELMDENSEYLEYLSPTVSVSGTVKVKSNSLFYTSASGVSEDYFSMKGYEIAQGRGLQYTDMADRKKVCVIGQYLNMAYFGGSAVGQTIKIERVREMFQEAIDNPAEENVFKQLRLNMWVASLTRFIPEQIYDLGNTPIDMEALKGRDCYGGLDLSSTGDITAFVLIFPPRTEDEKYIVLPFFWIPEDTIPLRVRRASVPYDVWHQQGYLMATEGNVIHYGFIEKFIEELGKQYHILEIAFDRWGATQMVQDLEGMGFTVVPFGQGFKDMSPPTKEFYKLLMEGRIVHGGNPIMAWMAGNVVVDTDPAGNIKPTKAKSPEKIDGIVAAIMALDRCIRNEGQQQGSIYDERDMIVF